jgi:branched-chain amino acid transport system substrate-binding protein
MTSGDTMTSMKLPNVVDVAIMLPATGDLSSHGQDNSIAAELGVADFNQFLDDIDAGWSMRLTIEDTQTDPIVALEKIQSLNSKGIKLIFGTETSAELRNIKSYADSNKMLLISPSSTAPALAIPDNIFRLVPDDTKQGKVIARLLETHGISVVIPIYRGDVWGDGLYESTLNSFTELGGVVDEGIRYSPESTVFSTEALVLSEKLSDYITMDEYSKDNVAILLIGFSEAVHILNTVNSYDELASVQWFGSDSLSNDNLITQDPIAASFAEKTGFIATQFAATKSPKFDHVRSHINEKIGTDPNSYAYSAYDSVWILGKSIQQTQSIDADVIASVLPTVAEYHSGSIGSIILNEAGDLAIGDYELWKIQDGQWVSHGKYNAGSDSIMVHN